MQYPKVSIITVNYKQEKVTCELLKSIAKLNYPNLEVIAIDNESDVDNCVLYRLHYPNTITLQSETNLGFAGANNLGIKIATGDYLFFLNNDTEVSEGTIESLISVFKRSKVGAVCPVIKYYDKPNSIQYAGFTPIHPITGRNKMIRELPKDKTLKTGTTPYFHGAAVMVRREVLKQVGKMSEDYFLYYEELDWSQQFIKADLEIRVDYASFVLHKESISTGKASPLKTYYQTKNRLLFMKRNSALLQWVSFLLFFFFITSPFTLIKMLKGKQWAHIKAFKAGLRQFFKEHTYQKTWSLGQPTLRFSSLSKN